jgi:hypothetical protein
LAFSSCSTLTNLTIDNGLISIGDDAFDSCTSLTSVTIPDSVTTIGDSAFFYCTQLTSVSIGNGVATIGDSAFDDCPSLTSVIIGNGVTTIMDSAFYQCASLRNVYFLGNAPVLVGSPQFNASVTLYYLPGRMGWSSTLAGRATVVWNPQAQTGDGSFGVQNNQFGFNITGSSNLVVIVVAATNLSNPAWVPVGTNTLNTFVGTNGTSYFTDPQWTNYPNRFYCFRSP